MYPFIHHFPWLLLTLAVLEAVPPRRRLRLAALFHDIGKPIAFARDEKGCGHFYGHHLTGCRMTEKIMRRLRYDRQTRADVALLVAGHMSRFPQVRNGSLERLIIRMGERNLDDLFDLQRADILGSRPPHDFSSLDVMREGIRRILAAKTPLSRCDLAVDGYDLAAAGVPPGPAMGRPLDALLEAVMQNPAVNDRARLLDLARAYANNPTLRPPEAR